MPLFFALVLHVFDWQGYVVFQVLFVDAQHQQGHVSGTLGTVLSGTLGTVLSALLVAQSLSAEPTEYESDA